MNVIDFGAFQASLKFDPRVIEVDNVVLGDFLGSTGRQTTPLVTQVDKTSGQISFVAFTSGESAGLIEAEVGNGLINVSACFGDLNQDKIIDISDLQIVAGRVGEALGDIDYESLYDINSDGLIDNNDVILITDRLNETCP
jgi:hypothetical protein